MQHGTIDRNERIKRMSRLIDADEYRKRIDHYPLDIRSIAKKELRYCKTVDAVQVVRCKECVRGITYSDEKYCNGEFHSMDFFCADGERKEQEDAVN